MGLVEAATTTSTYIVTLEVTACHGGWRLDAFLRECYPRRSRQRLQAAITEGRVTLKRDHSAHLMLGFIKPSTKVFAGDEVVVLRERKPEPPVSFDYRVLYEDDHLFVIDKPGNLPVHPAGSYFFNTLLMHLRSRGQEGPLKGEQEYYLVHRIDRETSGILVLAKNREAAAGLVRQFAERTTEKRYLAIVRGIPPESFEVHLAMNRSTTSSIGLKMAVMPEADGGLPASTLFRRLEVAGDFALLECRPKTGRQHQLRVHLESAGHPIVGDKLYGLPEEDALAILDRVELTPEREARLMLPRHALHAAGIRFTHPFTRQKVEFSSDLPAELRAFFTSKRA